MLRPASRPRFSAAFNCGMSPVAVAAVIGAIACCLLVSAGSEFMVFFSGLDCASMTLSIAADVPAWKKATQVASASNLLFIRSTLPRRTGQVLLVADLLHPHHVLAIECFLDGDVGHGSGRRRA